ncbi:F-box domain-containing protein [Caenorhabditis elegans]|uniref:F-box domain-containing protein n=1 Tax=Caenorhabditis elegans TaxID=6239 RepID=A4F330_CAEEL|nr:F-box domain-containing protein [Caenorhabditis elegans]CCD73936.1 F-box domain-containing protein [Caenorhabditis elegans]|eukprot:NP_497364.1 F-box A protein [Caenorhabditis elegans]
MTSKPLTLLDLPISIANQVLEKLEPVEILACRKVCRSLRSAIDKSVHFNKISIELENHDVLIDFDGIEITYRDAPDGESYVIYNGQSKTIKGVHYRNAAFNDLKILLKNVSKLYILRKERYRHNTVNFLVNVLKEEVNIHVDTITLNHFSFDDVLLILPLFNCKTLKKISLRRILEIGRFELITYLDQWKNSKIFSFRDSSLNCEYIEYLFHFEEFCINTHDIPMQSVIKIRDDLLQRSTFQKCTFLIQKLNFKPVELARVFQPDYAGGDEFKLDYSNDKSNFAIHYEYYSFDDDDEWEFVIQRAS